VLLIATPHTRVRAGQEASGTDDRETFTYTVKKGDTLWDISETLYRDPWVWPKVWQWNPTITNPHWIYPGTELRLYYRVPGTTILAVVPEGAVPTPPSAVAILPSPASIPPSLPPPPPLPPRVPSLVFEHIDQVGFITPFPLQGDGVILGEIHLKTLISQGDAIFLQMKAPGEGAVGDRYYVFHTSDLIRHPISNLEVGYLNTPMGVVEITEVAPDHAKARVLTSYEPISKGDKLLPYKKRAEEIVLQDGTEPKEGRIVVAKGQLRLSGDHQIVFIDLGADDDVKAGNRFEVFREPRARRFYGDEWSEVGRELGTSLISEPVGEILVLSAEKETAAAIVTKAKLELYPGERLRMKTHR
jgi:hypothetical protein